MLLHDFGLGIKVVDVEENDDGTANVILDLTPSFKDWFCKMKNLETFNKEIFDEWFFEALRERLKNNDE